METGGNTVVVVVPVSDVNVFTLESLDSNSEAEEVGSQLRSLLMNEVIEDTSIRFSEDVSNGSIIRPQSMPEIL